MPTPVDRLDVIADRLWHRDWPELDRALVHWVAPDGHTYACEIRLLEVH